MNKEITSVQNAYIKEIFQLKEKSRARKKSGLFFIEGLREIKFALQGHYQLESILYDPELLSENNLATLTSEHTESIKISKEVYHKLAHRDTTEGVIAIAKTKTHHLADINFKSDQPLVLVAEAPEKPGNIGALLRTADAAKVDAVIIANPKTDLYNPNIIRSSVGCVFTNQIAMATTSEIIAYLKDQQMSIFCAALQASEIYTSQDYTKPSAIVVGTEATGLSKAWLDNSTQNIIIPMQGEIDSMNVSVAAGILIFEAKRQRDFL